MMRKVILILVVALAIGIPMIAEEVAADKQQSVAAGPCSLAGVWYGGSSPNYPYLWTFTPSGGGRFTTITELGADATPFGFIWWTDWVGEATSTGSGTWDWSGISFWILDPAVAASLGVDASLPELDIVHSTVEFVDCNTIVSTIDVYAAYFEYTDERTPFIDPYDASYMAPGETIVETYHRMPRTTRDDSRMPKILPRPSSDRAIVLVPKR